MTNRSKLAYLDTKIWNLLLERSIDQVELTAALATKGWKLAASNFNRVELEQTILTQGREHEAHGLVGYLNDAFRAGTEYIKDPLETIAEEMSTLVKGGATSFRYGSVDRDTHIREVDGDLSTGYDQAKKDLLTNRRVQNERDRYNLALMDSSLRDRLRLVPKSSLKEWISEQSLGSDGRKILCDLILMRFPQERHSEVETYARELLISATGAASRTVVRAHLYVFWRTAQQQVHGDPPARSLFDDTYHMGCAAYCDAYVTADRDQAKYQEFILPRCCSFHLYERDADVADFLLRTVTA